MARAPKPESAPAGIAFTVERAALAEAVSAVTRAVPTKNTIPILGNVLMRAEGATLTITGTNLDQQATVTVPAEVAGGGTFTVNAGALHEVARRAEADASLAFKVAPMAGTAGVTSGRSRISLPTLPPEDFPELYGVRAQGSGPFYTVELPGSVLADLIGRIDFAISTEETRWYLNGVYAHTVERDGKPVLRLVSTDGHRLARVDTTATTKLEFSPAGAIIPTKAIQLFARAAVVAGDKPVVVEFSPTLVSLTTGGTAIVSKLLDHTFPDYAKVIPTDFHRTVKAATVAFARAVERVAALSTERGRGVKVEFGAEHVAISLQNTDGGAITDEVDIELEGEPLSIGFNANYLAEILSHSGGDTVRIRLGATAGQPAVITDTSGDGLYVLMPMRI